MDAGLLSAVMNNIVARLFTLAEQKYNLYKNFNYDVTYLTNELKLLTGAIDMQLLGHTKTDAQPQLSLPVDRLRQVAHEIEDCLDRIMYRQYRKEQHESDKTGNTGKNVLIKDMQRLKKVIEDAVNSKGRYSVPHRFTPHQHQYSSDCPVPPERIMGIQRPLKELQKQLEEENLQQLKVISIVGSCGSGKTVLAQKLYDIEAGSHFEIRAWVYAADMNPIELITDILRQVLQPLPLVNSNTLREHSIILRNHLTNKRYFIVIDHVHSTIEWKDIEYAFPRDSSSRIVVTTKIQTVANSFSCSNGYVHKMRRLNHTPSKELFLKEASMEHYSTSLPSDSEAILDICDGHPLALSTVGQFMGQRSRMTGPYWEGLCEQLRGQLKNDKSLDKMHQALIHDYNTLSSPALRACLLYFAMFPINHRVRSKRLMRRWIAEGFVRPRSRYDPAAQEFEDLLDRNIIQPIDVSNNMTVKTCKTYGMMHLFITLQSRSEYFIALFDDGNSEPSNVRRLSIRDNNIPDDSSLKIDLSLVRSLIVFGKAGKAILDFGKYLLLKVLDLQECSDLQNEHLNEVCNLYLLKYLSLGINVTKIPKKIKKLTILETLDLRRTAIEIVPIEVFQLPKLLHLFGMFKLPDVDVQDSNKFLSSAKSELQTLAGFIFNDSKGFVELMSNMKKLHKVEIRCESSAPSTSLTNLQTAIQGFIREEKDARKKAPRSLSINFNGCSEELLQCLKGDCHLSSLKLHGKLQELPGFVTALPGLRELCLETTKLTVALLTALVNLKDLQYLKLIADELDESVLKDNALPALVRLCFVLKTPTLPTIEDGALPKLESLQLLCDGLNGLSGIQINHFKHLREVIIDVGVRVTSGTIQIWLDAADNHPKRPKVILLNAPDPTKDAPIQDSAASGANEYGAETHMRSNGSNSTSSESSIASSIVPVLS